MKRDVVIVHTNERICIFSDSSADIPYATAEKYGIKILPILITFGGKTIREYFDITPEKYWKVLEEADGFPLTAQVPINEFYEFYKSAAKDGYNKLLGITINGGGSGTYSAACTAREMFYSEYGKDMEIVLLDSRLYAYVYGHVVVECAKLASDGRGFSEIVSAAEDMLSRSCAILGVYTLKYLKKSGRISGGAAFVGDAIGLKPISLVADGGVNVCGKVRGNKSVVPALAAEAKRQIGNGKCDYMSILYADVPEQEIDRLEKIINSEFGIEKVERIPIGPSVTTNAGPNSIALAFCKGKNQ